MTDGDLAFAARLYASTRLEELARSGWPETRILAFLAGQHEAQHQHYSANYRTAQWLILERGGAPIGRLYLDEWADQFRVVDISLLPEHRGGGIGGAVLADVMAAAAEAGKAVSIHVEKENAARRLYLRLGFAVVADKGVYDLMLWRGSVPADQ